jgi:hypothetical protein
MSFWSEFRQHVENNRCDLLEQMLLSPEMHTKGNLDCQLDVAVRSGHFEVVDLLLRKTDADPSAFGNAMIQIASFGGFLPIVIRLLQDHRVNPSMARFDALQIAAQQGHTEIVDALLADSRMDPCADNNMALVLAARCGRRLIVEKLLADKRVDPSIPDNRAVMVAARNNQTAVVDLLLEDSRVDYDYAIRCTPVEHRKRFERRERLTEICIGLQDIGLPAWVTLKILKQVCSMSTLKLHQKWNLVCTVKHFHDRAH